MSKLDPFNAAVAQFSIEDIINKFVPYRGPLDQVFTHVDSETGKNTTFLVSVLYRTLLRQRHVVNTIDLDAEHVELLKQKRAPEQLRVDRLAGDDLFFPLLFVEVSDGTHILIDGTHRYLKLWAKGVTRAYAFVVKEEIWSQHLFLGMPDRTEAEVLASPGLVETEASMRRILR